MYQFYFFFNATAPTETYTLSLHDALPILEPDQRVHLVGTAGRILIEVPFNIPPGLRARILLFAGGDPPVSPGVEVHETEAGDQYGLQADAFSRSVRQGGPVPTDPHDAVSNLEVMERIV